MKLQSAEQSILLLMLQLRLMHAAARHHKKCRALSLSSTLIGGSESSSAVSGQDRRKYPTAYCDAARLRGWLNVRFLTLSIIHYQLPIVSVWGEYIDELIQMKTAVASGGGNLPAGDYYPLQDLLYRNTALTDDSGNIVETYDTDAYGNTLIFKAAGTNSNWWADDAVQTDNPACEVIYCGYRYDPETELYYVRNRTYDPVLGRWLQRDLLGYVDGMNLYEYTNGKPSLNRDAYGLTVNVRVVAQYAFPCGNCKPQKYMWRVEWDKQVCGKWTYGGAAVGGCGEPASSVRVDAVVDMINYSHSHFSLPRDCCVKDYQTCVDCCVDKFFGVAVNTFTEPAITARTCIEKCGEITGGP